MGVEVKHSPGIISSDDNTTNYSSSSVALSVSSVSSVSSSSSFLSSQVSHDEHQPIQPVSQHDESYVITHRILTEKETKILSKKIKEAFEQIAENNYILPLFKYNTKVYAAAVAVYSTSKVMVRFADVVWKDDRQQTPSLNEIGSTHDYDTSN
jgi:endoglucanase Acf2